MMPKSPDLRNLGSVPARRSLGHHVYEKLKQAIIRGDLAPGSRVVESQVATAMDISRTPVREAIHKLEREGLLKRFPTGRLFVVGMTRAEIEETFGIRSVLESYAARLAVKRHKEHELRGLEDKIAEYQVCLDKGDMEALLRINTEFHDLLYTLSRSPKLINMINDLREAIYRVRQVILKNEEWARTSNDDHRLIVKFIRKRDSEAVERLVREHMRKGQFIVLEEFDMQTS